MRRIAISIFIFLLTASAFAAETRRYFVGTRGPMSDEGRIRRLYRDVDGEVTPRRILSYANVNAFAADLTEGEVRALKASPDVTYIEPVVEMHAFTPPLRNYSGAQTVPAGIDAVKARDAWVGVTARGAGVNVVVADTGVDYTHPDLKGIWKGGEDFINNDLDPMDDAGHGTHVSGTIAAADDAQGVVGIAPSIRLWGLKILNSEGTGSNDKLVKALDWVISKKKDLGGNWVINLSLGHAGISVSERNAVNRALDAGIVIVAASGNESSAEEGVKPVAYPAGYDNVLTVGAVDTDMTTIAVFSNQGPEMDLVAPGVNVLSTVPTGFGSKTYVGAGNDFFYSLALAGSPRGSITAEYVYCGLGTAASDFPASVRGKIALIQRGGTTFAWKSRRAKEAGAIGVVIFNSENPASPGMNWTMRPIPSSPSEDDAWTTGFEYLLTVNMVYADGLALSKTTGTITLVNDKDDFDVYQGTSMATPHVTGAVALVWALAPDATPAQVRNALTSTAKDLGRTGLDSTFGYGLLDVLGAAKALAPGAFVPVETNPRPTTGRKLGRRG